jgi:EmrB/QacA subfamily drug resistance transporter
VILTQIRRLLLIGLGSAIVPLDSAVNIAFPAITRAFGGPLQSIQWLIIAYVLTYASVMLAVGRIGDLVGYRTVFRLGLAWSAVALILCAAAPSYPLLLAARVAQGIGSAFVLACGPALVTSLYPESERARALGIYAMMFAVGTALGPIVGGALIQVWGWPAVFWFRAPIAAAALLLLPDLPQPARVADRRASFDLLGAALLAAALAGLLLALNRLPAIGDGDVIALLLSAGAAAALAIFIRHEGRAREPIIDLTVFRSVPFSLVNLGSILVNLASFAVLLLVPYYLARVAQLPDVLAGLVLATSPIGVVVGSPVGAALIRRAGAHRLTTAGAALCAMGLALVAAAGAPANLWRLVPSLAVQGFGLGLFQVAYMDLVTGAMAASARGVAGSLAMLTRTFGLVTGAAVLTLVYGAVEATEPGAGGGATDSFLAGFKLTFWFAATLPIVVVAWGAPRWFAQRS